MSLDVSSTGGAQVTISQDGKDAQKIEGAGVSSAPTSEVGRLDVGLILGGFATQAVSVLVDELHVE